jgi:hypothetical protein
MSDFEILKFLSVTLTRDKQLMLEEELQRYGKATNWTIRQILKQRLNSQGRAMEVLQDSFIEQFDRRRHYLRDVVKTARVEVSDHRKMADNIRGMKDKTPYFRPGRMILSQPLIRLSETAVTLTVSDGSKIAIPFDKRSRNRLVEKIKTILKGEKSEGINRKYDRIRITWNKEGFADIDVRVKLSNSPGNNGA